MSSFKKFLNFLEKHKEFSEKEIDLLHQLLFTGKTNNLFTANRLSILSETLPVAKAFEVLLDLKEYGLIKEKDTFCPSCGEELTSNSIEDSQCEDCDAIIDVHQLLVFSISGILGENEQGTLFNKKQKEKDALKIARYWGESKHIIYMLTDLVQSQKIQAESEKEYNIFLQELRKIWKYKILSQIKNPYLVLGEIGDAYKLAFIDVNDALLAIRLFSKEIVENESLSKFSIIKTNIDYFPKFTAVLDSLPSPGDGKGGFISPEDLISSTLNGVYDFNTKRLTDLFRLDSAMSLDYQNYDNYDIGLFILEDAIDTLNKPNVTNSLKRQLEDVNAKKQNEVVSSGKASLLLIKNQSFELVDNLHETLQGERAKTEPITF